MSSTLIDTDLPRTLPCRHQVLTFYQANVAYAGYLQAGATHAPKTLLSAKLTNSTIGEMSSTTFDSETDPFPHTDGWSVSRSLFKACCWALDGFFAFSICMIAVEAALKKLRISTDLRYAMTSLLTAVAHQIIFHAFERLQTLTTKRAIPAYRGNWWLNFILADHLSNEFTSFVVVGGIQALCALWVIKNPAYSLLFLMLLEPVTFFLWALAEDFTNKFVLRRKSEPEEHPHVLMNRLKRLRIAFRWSFKRLLQKDLWLYNLISIAVKTASTHLTYRAGDALLSQWAGVTELAEATPGQRALIAFAKTVIFFETFLFIGIRCPDAALEHSNADN